jgi:hypothetical protein
MTARFCCGYCQIQEAVSGIRLTIEHIIPTARSGQDNEDNLWLSCRLCNEAKGKLIAALDPDSDKVVPLYNPRSQHWYDHFAWHTSKTQILGLTPIGRATVLALDLNHPFRVRSRVLWVEAGFHPPDLG